MKHRTKILGFVALLMLLLVFLIPRETRTSGQTASQKISHAKLSTAKSTRPDVNPLMALLKAPIEFYGIVLDQNNRPVTSAKVKASVLDHPIDGTEAITRTDLEGRFMIRSRGMALSIRVSKSGYYYVDGEDVLKPSTQGFDFGIDNGRGIYSGTLTSPTVFHLRSPGNPIPLERLELLRGQSKIPRDGTPVFIHFSKPTKVKLKVSCLTLEDPKAPPTAPYDWRCELTVENGELQAAQDEHDFIAPESGYQASIVIDMPKTLDPNTWTDRADVICWLHFQDGTYGRLRFKMNARGDHFATIEGFRNPIAIERNLEAKVEREWE